MSTTNRILLDSSFFVESYKGRNPDFYRYVTEHRSLECCITETVCSEYWYHLFGVIGGKSPLTLKGARTLSSLVQKNREWFSFFEQYTFLNGNTQTASIALEAIELYNLLSNDALIIGACLCYKIPFLESYDPDFTNVCAGEGITLITPENYSNLLPPFQPL